MAFNFKLHCVTGFKYHFGKSSVKFLLYQNLAKTFKCYVNFQLPCNYSQIPSCLQFGIKINWWDSSFHQYQQFSIELLLLNRLWLLDKRMKIVCDWLWKIHQLWRPAVDLWWNRWRPSVLSFDPHRSIWRIMSGKLIAASRVFSRFCCIRWWSGKKTSETKIKNYLWDKYSITSSWSCLLFIFL